MSEKKLGTETIHVLNDKYQFVSAQQAANAKWLDLDNVVSVKRDKTIYAIRARTGYDFNNQDQNCEFFANLNGSTGVEATPVLVKSNIFRYFHSNKNNIFERSDYPVYGNGNIAGTLNMLGWAGSLDVDFLANVALYSGNINVSPSVSVFSNLNRADLNQADLTGWLKIDGLVKTVQGAFAANFANIANVQAITKVFVSNTSTTKWNRLINANLSGNTVVTASCDPCDRVGKSIPFTVGGGNTIQTNEAYRYQFAVKRNAEIVSNENPIYIGRISRFGTNLSDVSGTMASVMSIDGFTGNFYANLPSDNVIYVTPETKLTEMSITGNYKSTDVNLFNSNYKDSNIGNMNGNLLSSNIEFNSLVTIGKYNTSAYSDYIANPNLTLESASGLLSAGDKFTVVQTDLGISTPLYLFDRLKVVSDKSKLASEIFAASSTVEVTDLVNHTLALTPDRFASAASLKVAGSTVLDSKVVNLSMYNIVANNWQSTLTISPNLKTPELTGTPSAAYTTGNIIQLYLRRGSIAIDNYSVINTTNSTNGSKYFNTIPSFLKSYSEPTGGINIEDATVIPDTQANLSLSCTINQNFKTPDNISITASIAPDLCFYVYANADMNNRVDRRANVVIPVANTVISNIWQYDNLNAVKTGGSATAVKFDPKIIYNTFDGLTAANPFSKKNLTYTVKFGKVLGETNLENDQASNTLYGFNANLSASSGQGNVVSSTIPNLTALAADYKLYNNDHMNGLLLNGVAYSEYEFTDFSHKFTDLGNVLNLITAGNDTNYKYSSVLPVVGNLGTGSAMLNNVRDNYMNVLVDYVGSSVLGEATDIHRLAIFDNQYRYYINSVQKTGGGPINITTTYNGTTSDNVFDIIQLGKGAIASAPRTNTEYIAPANFLTYTYEKIYESSSNDSFYPFTTPNEAYADRLAKKMESDNYLFPGFVYKHSGETVEFYNYKDETTCDFVINNNIIGAEQTLSLIVFSSDVDTKTLKVGLSTQNSTKSVVVKPIRIGGSVAAKQWYTPIVLKISAESNSYVVLLIKIKVDASTEVFTGLDDNLAFFTPLAVNINSIEKTSNGSNQIQFKSKLLVYKANNDPDQSYYTNIVNSHKTSLSNFSYSSQYGSSNTNVGINLYSIPVNNTVILFSYRKDVIKKVMNYNQTDYELDNSVNLDNSSLAARYKKINRPIATLNFASSNENTGSNPKVDGLNPYIAPNTTRFYLDQGFGGAVYIDYLNTSITSLKNMSKFQLSRSVEWILTRQEEGSNIIETVGRGLLSKNPMGVVATPLDYVIGENLGKAPSGFFMNVNTNIVDIASHLIVQKKQTGALQMNTPPQFVLKTKSDAISVSLFHQNPSTLATTFIKNVVSDSRIVDLGSLFATGTGANLKKSTLPTFEFDLVRSLNNSPTNHLLVSDALFRIRIRLDNYSIVHNKLPVNGSNVLFSSLTSVESVTTPAGLALNIKMTNELIKTLNSDYVNITSPSPFGQEHSLIKTFVHRGFGKVDMRVYDFTSHYDNELPSQELTTAVKSFNFPDVPAYSFTIPVTGVSVTKDIEYEGGTVNKFFVNLGNVDFPDKLYLKGTGLASLPVALNDKETFLLYTGTRPIGFITYEITVATTLNTFVKKLPYTFKSNSRVFNSLTIGDAFSSAVANSTAPGATVYKMYYSVALTNRTSDKDIKVRGVSYKIKSDEVFKITSSLNYTFGVFRSVSDLLSNMKFNMQYGTVTNSLPLSMSFIGSTHLTSNFEEKPDKYITYSVSNDNNEIFRLKLSGSIGDTPNFKVLVNPSKVDIYQAIDVNENGELDSNGSLVADSNNVGNGSANSVATLSASYGLEQAFSELLYNLRSNPSNSVQYRAPAIVQTMNLSNEYQTIVGSGLDIKFNKKWAIGYNLDCFFTIRNNNICTFDVISIDTDTQNTASSVASLKVQNSLPLIVGTKNSWARSKGYTDDSNDHCGLTFKLKEGVAITSSDVVRLFVDNTPLSNNLQLNVNVSGKNSKSYKLSDYDNETYSRLLDKQIKLKNQFE